MGVQAGGMIYLSRDRARLETHPLLLSVIEPTTEEKLEPFKHDHIIIDMDRIGVCPKCGQEVGQAYWKDWQTAPYLYPVNAQDFRCFEAAVVRYICGYCLQG